MDKNQKFNQVISNIFRVNSKIRYVSIIDLDGRIIASEMKSDLQSLLKKTNEEKFCEHVAICLLYTSPSPRDQRGSRMPTSA